MAIGKTIALFSDGTGNSSGKLFKTNVWRMYQALDLDSKVAAGVSRQIAFYDDGVGTSTFRPLALLGGAFGWGLKRNVLDLYKFLCRNYQEGDQIYAFGFSRGAFTIRLLVGLVASYGLLTGLGKEELDRLAPQAYARYRRKCFKAQGVAKIMRGVWDALKGLNKTPPPGPVTPVEHIAFVGVWDTVAAYGTPIAELTRGIDKWVWPLWFRDYDLDPKVQVARHALALDDERDTFHPLIWNEEKEETDRIQQVWFTGMHADVGGGYAEDSLAHVSLEWMMQEAQKAGLRFREDQLEEVGKVASATAPMHDSRRGLSAYYRYQPRRLSAYLDPDDPTTLLLRDPDQDRRAILKSIKVHASVLHRIRAGPDKYAPLVLPADYRVVGASSVDEQESDDDRKRRAAAHQWVWNYVWKRRVNYFLTFAITLAVVAMPFIQARWKPAACTGECQLSDAVRFVGEALPLPAVLDRWIEAFAATPLWFLALVAAIWLLMRRAGRLQTRIEDRMRALWAPAEFSPQPFADERSGWERFIKRLRTARAYQRSFQFLKWQLLPHAFGLALLGSLLFLAVEIPPRVVQIVGSSFVASFGAGGPAGQDKTAQASAVEPGYSARSTPFWHNSPY